MDKEKVYEQDQTLNKRLRPSITDYWIDENQVLSDCKLTTNSSYDA